MNKRTEKQVEQLLRLLEKAKKHPVKRKKFNEQEER